MTSIIVQENGSKVASSNSYVDLVYATEFHTLYNNTDWSGDDAELEQHLVNACLSLELLYGDKYLSQRCLGSQSLLWPRFSFYTNHYELIVEGTIPTSLKNAQCELALLSLKGVNIFPEVNQQTNVRRSSDKVGELSTDVEYFKPPELATFENFRKVQLFLYPIIQKNSRKSINFSR